MLAKTQFIVDMKKVVNNTTTLYVDDCFIVPYNEFAWTRIWFSIPAVRLNEMLSCLNKDLLDYNEYDSDVRHLIYMFENIDDWYDIDETYEGIDGKWVDSIFTNISSIKPKVSSEKYFNVVKMNLEDSEYINTMYIVYRFAQIPKSGIFTNIIAQLLI